MPLLLDLSHLRSGTERVDRQLAPDAFPDTAGDFRVVSPVDFTAEIRKDGQNVRATGRVRATLEMDCGRCLEPFAIPVDAAFDALFLPASANAGRNEQEVGEENWGMSFYTNDTIDLAEIVREQFYLAIPMKPLCREECRGLCPVCGINRNRETCACQTAWEDPRLEPLKRFRMN